MADEIKLSALAGAAPLLGGELVPLVQGGSTRRTPLSALAPLIAGQTGVVIPYYAYPGNPYSDTAFRALLSLIRRFRAVPAIVVLNPGNGPGAVWDGNFAAAIRLLKASGARVCGYVGTDYAARAEDAVLADIDAWLTIYAADRIDGLFIDEVPWDTAGGANLARYAAFRRYARQRGLWPIIDNPGTNQQGAWFAHTDHADITLVHENSGWPSEADMEGNYSGGHVEYPASLRGALIYAQAGIDAAAVRTLAQFCRWLYVSHDGGDGNPWDSLSTLLEPLLTILSGAADDSKLALTGGELTGDLTVAADIAATNFRAEGYAATGPWPYFLYYNVDGQAGKKNLSLDYTPEGRLNYAASDDNGAWVRDVLQIDHGGAVTVPTGPLKVGSNTVWHAGNLTPFNGAYSSLTGIPATFAPSTHSHAYSSLTGLPTLFSGNYADLSNKPTIPTTASQVGAAPLVHSHQATDIYGFANAGVNAGYTVTSSTNITLSEGNRTFTNSGATAGYRGGRAGIGRSTGKWYFEVEQTLGASLKGFGLVTSSQTLFTAAIGQSASTWGIVDSGSTDGFCSGSTTLVTVVSGLSISPGNVVGIAVDLDTGRFWASLNGVWLASGNPATGSSPGLSNVAGTVYPASTSYAASAGTPAGHTIRLLSTEFSYPPPAGFAAWADDLQFAGTATTAATATTAITAVKLQNWTYTTAGGNLNAGNRVAIGTAAGPRTLTLPASPAAGNEVAIMDGDGTFGVNALTVARNGSTIMGLAEDMTVDTSGVSFSLVYSGVTWRLA